MKKTTAYSEDFTLWSYAADNLTIVNLQEPLLFYREKGSFTFKKNLIRTRETRRVVLTYAKRSVGLLPTLFLLIRLEIKKAISLLYNLFCLWNHVLFLPNKSLSMAEKEKYQKILTQVTKKNWMNKPLHCFTTSSLPQ